MKLQVTGPATLALALERASASASSDDDLAACAGEICGWVAASAREQVATLAGFGLDVLLICRRRAPAR